MDVDAALAEVPVNIFPLIDDTDFKTRETAIVFNQAGMDLVWNFVTPAGAMTQTAVTPASTGNYLWTNEGDGMYAIQVPASGGASINNDTEGFGWFTGIATGVLAWRGPIIGFRAAGLNDKIIESAYDTTRGLAGTALPAAAAEAAGGLYTRGSGAGQLNQQANGQHDVNMERMLNVAQSVTDLKDFADAGYDPATDKVQGVVLVDTLTTYTGNTPQTGDVFPLASTEIADIKAKTDQLTFTIANKVDASIQAAGDFAQAAADKVWSSATRTLTAFSTALALSVWDVLESAILTASSIGLKVKNNLDAAITSRSSHSAADVWSVAARLLTAGTNIVLAKGVGVTGFNDLSAAQVNAEVVDALATDTYAEPGQETPGATVTLATKISYLYKAWRNRFIQNATDYKLYGDDAATVHQKAAVSDDGTTFDRGEVATGP